METPSEQDPARTPEPDTGAEVDLNALRDRLRPGKGGVDLNALRDARRAGALDPAPLPTSRDGETQPLADSGITPSLESVRRAIREGRATNPMPSAEEVRDNSVERGRQVDDTKGAPEEHTDDGSSERE